jgi:DsbC/DsbD-like thiol-disulfide interchange protein/cytochrome c biogenesis protein CcdA
MTTKRCDFLVIRFLWAMLLALGIVAPAQAQNEIAARLVAETQSPAPGARVMFAVEMTPRPGWHGYWKNPGDAGQGPLVEWTLPKGVTAGALTYPVPERLVVFGLMNHVYEGAHAFLVPLAIPKGLAVGTVLPIALKIRYLACSDKVCTPQQAELTQTLTLGNGRGTGAAAFDAWRSKIAKPLGSEAKFAREGKTVRVSIPFPATSAITDPWLFADDQYGLINDAPQRAWRDGDRLIIEARVGDDFKADQFSGLISIGKDLGFEVSARPGSVAIAGKLISGKGGETGLIAALLAIGGALFGGLLLNIMPCVFPVISLKALSLARGGGEEAAVRQEALFYAAGTILTCLALGAVLLILRAGGSAIGWAFQLQNPAVILFLLALVWLITLNLLGVFHLRSFGGGDTLARQGGKGGAFWTGALAAFVATPCTGPFMAAALGAALVLPVWVALLIFAGLGLGLALPFLALGYVPALRTRLPKPGAWMVTFQRWMALPMALTSLALAWLLWRQTGTTGLLIGAILTVIVGAVCVMIGRAQRSSASESRFARTLGLGALIAVVGGMGVVSTLSVGHTLAAGMIPFSEAKLAELRAKPVPIFLYFTADWCLTCKVNEKAALETEDVQAAFKANGVTVMIGDWSTPDPAISRFLESRGRSGIPLYLYYTPGIEDPMTLPQILTPSLIKTALVSR